MKNYKRPFRPLCIGTFENTTIQILELKLYYLGMSLCLVFRKKEMSSHSEGNIGKGRAQNP